MSSPAPDRPIDVSVVVAVYDVARYLPEFLGSLEAQTGVDLDRVEVVAVDDGSTDDSLAVLHRWQARSPLRMTVLTKPNGGQGSARNLGMQHATGTWLTFTDPDDVLEPGYLAAVLGFARAHPDVELVATHRVFLDDATGDRSDTHPLRAMFADGDRLVDLDRRPDHFHGSAPASFVRRARVEALGLRFDERIRPNFEDGHFCTRYLLGCDRPLVGFVGSAVYLYRKRSDGTSTLNTSVLQAERYTNVPRFGYLDALERATDERGRTAEWVQNFVLYELSWYFGSEDAPGGSATAAVGAVAHEFLTVLRLIRARLDPGVIASFKVRWLSPAWRQVLLHGLGDTPWRSECAVLDTADAGQRLARVVHRWTGEEPDVEYTVDGVPTAPAFTKLRTITYFDTPLLSERISWLPADGAVRVRLDGRLVELRRWWFGPLNTAVEPFARPARRETPLEVLREDPVRALGAVRRRVVRAVAGTPPVRRRFAGAWVLVDRIHDADDSAEHLFTWLRENRPDVNAWFSVEAGTAAWQRLSAGPHGDRLLAWGSRQWELAMLDARHLISSHIDVPIHRPPRIVRLARPGPPRWRFTFLQHGVIKDDLSRWLNPKPVDLFVTSTPAEHASIVGDGSPYVFTDKEVKLTGLPRFDRYRAAAAAVAPHERRTVLVAPTWRHWLLPPLVKGTQRRELDPAFVERFLETDYARSWLAVLRSDELAALAREHDVTVGFLPHPNLAAVLPALDLPAHVEPMTFEGRDVPRTFATAAALVTDYSSTAFNAAYVDRPVVYFQFDADLVLAGGHVGRAGYFDYERDGFGPVTTTAEDAVKALVGVVERGGTPAPEYAERIARTFVLRDGRCCERVVAQIERLDRPHR